MLTIDTCTGGIHQMVSSLEGEFQQHPILRHEFLEALRAGLLSKEQVRIWVAQQYWFSRQFPRCLAALYARIDDFEASRPLVDFLNVEHWGSGSPGAHWILFRDVLSFFDLNFEEMSWSQPLPETSEYLNLRLNMCLRKTPEEALGVVAFGHEFVNCSIFEAYLGGMERLPDITDRALSYFRAHVAEEPNDYRLLREIMISTCQTPASWRLVKIGAHDVLSERSVFFDRIFARIGGMKSIASKIISM